MNTYWTWVSFGVVFVILVLVVLSIRRGRCRKENYTLAKDKTSTDMFETLKQDLARLYPKIDKLDLNGLVSCIPEDSYTENKKHVSICLRNKAGVYYPYEKLLKIGIHELAHVMSKEYDPDHKTPEFINNYSSLMNKARELGYHVE